MAIIGVCSMYPWARCGGHIGCVLTNDNCCQTASLSRIHIEETAAFLAGEGAAIQCM
jgi:hypothetical protein